MRVIAFAVCAAVWCAGAAVPAHSASLLRITASGEVATAVHSDAEPPITSFPTALEGAAVGDTWSFVMVLNTAQPLGFRLTSFDIGGIDVNSAYEADDPSHPYYPSWGFISSPTELKATIWNNNQQEIRIEITFLGVFAPDLSSMQIDDISMYVYHSPWEDTGEGYEDYSIVTGRASAFMVQVIPLPGGGAMGLAALSLCAVRRRRRIAG